MITFNEADLTGNVVFRSVHSVVGFNSKWRVLGLIVAIVAPLLLFSLVTCSEGRFKRGSLWMSVTLNGDSYRLIGMSFVGDPMVWGFTIVVPCLVAVIGLATQRTLTLVNMASAKAT